MEQFTDQALIEEVLGGSRIAFDQLMQRYEQVVYRVCFSYTRNQDDAMDVTQNVFLKVYAKMGSYRGSGTFRSWLLRIAHRENINWQRSRRKHLSYEDLDPAHTPRHPADQESEVLRSERRRHLAGALTDLNPKQRLAVSLRYYEGLSIREIAAVLKTTEGNARSILFRSLQKLRNTLVVSWRENPA
jgi:RNA polymerase sigma-70 factor (ECF subfamily)